MAVRFDGIDDYIEIGNGFTEPITISVWFKFGIQHETYPRIWGFDTTNDLYLKSDNSLIYYIYNPGGGNELLSSQTALSKNAWHHAVVTMNEGNGVNLYVDGELKDSSEDDEDLSSSADFYIGADFYQGVKRALVGDISNVKIYNTALTANEVKDLYAGQTPKRGNLVGEWKLDSGLNFAEDTSSKNNHGELKNGAHYLTKINTSRVLYLKLDSLDDDTAWDYSGYNNHGSVSGCTLTDGKVFRACDFDGSSGYVDCGNDSSVQIVNDVTVMCWVYPNDLSGEEKIVSKAESSTSGYELFITNDNLRSRAGAEGDATSRDNTASGVITTEWQHIAFSWDGDTQILYRNGDVEARKQTTGTSGNPSHNLTIGKRADSDALYFDGKIDEVMIFNRALTPIEIENYYKLTKHSYPRSRQFGKKPPITGSKRLYLRMNNIFDSTTILDFSSYDNDGTLRGCSLVDGKLNRSLDFTKDEYIDQSLTNDWGI